MKPKSALRPFLLLAGSSLLAVTSSHAASAAWNVDAPGNWSDGFNWNPAAAPGATSGTTNTDTASFGIALTAPRIVTVDANRNLQGIDFTNLSGFGYTLSGGNLLLTNGGLIQTSGAGTAHTDTISSAIELQGDGGTASFTAGSSTNTRLLVIGGGVTGVSTGANVTTLTLNGGNTGNNAITGIIGNGSGGGKLALTKSGTGLWILSGANTYTGDTTLNGGTVAISNATSFGGSKVFVTGSSRINATGGITYANDIAVNAALTLQAPTTANNVNTTATFTGVLSGSGAISLPNSGNNGAQGILAFTNTANTFTGNVVLSASGSGDEFFSFISIGDGGNFTFAKNGNRQGIRYAGASNVTFNTRQINIASTMVNYGSRQGLDGGGANPVSSFENNGAGTVTFNTNMGMSSLANDGVLYFSGSNSGNNTFAGTIGDPTGTGKLWIGKLGTGTWILTGDNTYEGGTIIANGILSVGKISIAANAQPLGKGSTIQFGVGSGGASGTLVFTGSTNSTTDKQVVIGPLLDPNSAGSGSILNNGTGTLTFSNATFNQALGSGTVARTFTIGGTNADNNEIQGTIQNNAAGALVALTKTGIGTWLLSGNNTYTGATAVSGGTLRLSGTGRLGGGSYAGAISIGNGATLQYSGSLAQTFSGAITGAGGLTKDTNTSTLTLSNANNYSGGTTISTGTIEVKNSSALGSATGSVSVAAGAKLFVNANGVTLANNITLNGTTTNGAIYSGDLGTGNTTNLSGQITLNATSNVSNWWNVRTLQLSGKITGAGGLNFDRQGSGVGGRYYMTGAANDYAGATSVTGASAGQFGYSGQAMLYLGATNALPTTTALTLNYADLYLNGKSQTLPSISGSGSFSVQNGSTTAATLTLGSGNATSIFSGTIKDNGISVTETNATPTTVTGTVALTKIGNGSLTLSNTNTYSGATTVNAGKLIMGDAAADTFATSTVTVASNATLGGSGTIAGAVGVTGILAPGITGVSGGIGTLTAGSTTWNGGANTAATIWQFDLSANSNASDTIAITGDFKMDSTLGSVYKFDFMSSAPTTWGNVYTLVTWTGSTQFTDANQFTWSNLGGVYDLQPGTGFTLTGVGGNTGGSLTFTAVPEPTSALAGLLITAGLLRRRRTARTISGS